MPDPFFDRSELGSLKLSSCPPQIKPSPNQALLHPFARPGKRLRNEIWKPYFQDPCLIWVAEHFSPVQVHFSPRKRTTFFLASV